VAKRYAFVELTIHARTRMKERRVSEARITDTLEHPNDEFWRGEHKVACRDMPRNRRIEVVFVEVERGGVIGARVVTVIRRAGTS
jgi:hypothetical protein